MIYVCCVSLPSSQVLQKYAKKPLELSLTNVFLFHQSLWKKWRARNSTRAPLWLYFPPRSFPPPFAYRMCHPLHLKMDGILGEPMASQKGRTEPQHVPSCNLMPSCQLASPRRLKYSERCPQRRPKGPVERGQCWKQLAGRCHQVSGTWQQRGTGDWHLSPPFFAALLLPSVALTSLLASMRTSLQEEQAVPLHQLSTQNPRTRGPGSLLESCHEWTDRDEARTWNKMEMETMKFYALEQVINCSQLVL